MPYPICHVYVALHYSKDPSYIIGSIFPDTTHLLIKDKQHLLMKQVLNDINLTNESKEFMEGIKIHLALDSYFHKSYIYPKCNILSEEFNLNQPTAEGYIEIALDRIIDKKHPEIARIINKSMKGFSTKNLSIYLSKVLQKPVKEVKRALLRAKIVSRFKKPYKLRTLVIKALILRKYSRLKIKEFKLLKSRKILKRAEQLIRDDYQEELNKAIKAVKRLRKNPWKSS